MIFRRALDYGAIGMIIGHEMTHAFDALGTNSYLRQKKKIKT